MQLLYLKQVHASTLLLLWFIIHIPFCLYGQSVSQTVTRSFSYVPPRTQHTTLLSTMSTIIPQTSSQSSKFLLTTRTSILATSSTYLPNPTPTPSRPIPTLFISVHVPTYVYDGEEVLFNCSVEPSQNVTFNWRLQDEILAVTAQYITILRDNSDDYYCCEVNNTFHGASNHSCLLAPTVYLISSVKIGYIPQSQNNMHSKLNCFASVSNNSLLVKYYWEYVGRSGNTESIHSQTSEINLSSNNRTLTITGTSLTLSGVYTCSSYIADHFSTVRSDSHTVQQYSLIDLKLKIISPSSFSGSQLGVEIGGSLEVHCVGTGFPIEPLTWQIDGNAIEHSPPNIEIEEILPRINPDMVDGYVTEPGQVTLSISIHNIQNPIDRLTCVGSNIMGRKENSISVVLLAPPCTPEGVSVRELGETWAVVEWINGVTCSWGIQNVILFKLNLTELNGQEVALITSSVNTQLSSYHYNLSSLASNSFYKIKISGENTLGSSEYSISITLHTLAPPDTNRIMFPFGIIPGDSLVAHGKYAQSPAVTFKQKVPIGSRLSSVVYLSPLGVLSFDRPFHYWDVQLLGAGSSLQDLSILAPYWSDVDYSSQGSLFYQLYSDTQADSQILHNATQLAVQSASASISFIASSLLVVTWSRVLPSSGGQAQTFQENSFQLGLVTDHTTTYALFGYKRGDMSWSTVLGNDPLIGFSTASTLSQTHPLSRTPNAHEIDLTSGDELTVIGYNISYSLQEITKAEQQCAAWQQSASRLEVNTPECPCTLLQAAVDERFRIDNISPQIPEIVCYVSLFEYVGPNQRCCYSKRLLTLISEGIFRGSAILINPTVRSDLHLSGDYRAYENCCLLSDSCDKYFYTRVSNNCSQYTPTGFLWGFSLAHIITADSSEYRINGQGEYWLMTPVADCPIQVQARTELVQGFTSTSFTAISLSESICGSSIFISLSSDRTKLLLYLNNTEVALVGQELAVGCLLLTYLSEVESYRLKFSFGVSLTVWVLNTVLNFKMTFPREICYNRTQGLIGQWDGDASNDLLMRNGTLLSQNVTDREMEVFAESWRLTENESFMVYDTGNYSTFNPTDFEPTTFIDEILSAGVSPEIAEQCKDRRACLFDQLLTGQQGLANPSRDISLISIETEMEINAYPPYLTGSPVLVISTREEFSYVLTADNLLSHPMSLYVSSPIRDSVLSFSDEVYKLTGTITQEIGEFGISFHATDLITGLASRELSPTILFCTCPLLAQCSLSQQQMVPGEFYNLSCGCEKGINITEGHTCITSPDCTIQLDVYFVIDGTSTLGPTRFSEELDLTLNLIDRFNYPVGTIGNRVGYLVYTDDVVSYTNLTADFTAVITQLESTTFPGGNTNLTSPLAFLLSHIFTEKSSTQSLVAFLTLGYQSSSVDTEVLASLSEELERERGVRIVVIGFGTSLNETQLRAIATGDSVDNYLAFNSIAEAQSNESEITQGFCQTVIPPTTSTTQTTYTTYQSTTRTYRTTSPTPTSNLVLVTIKFTLSYATLYTLTNGDVSGFLSAIARGLDNKAPVGTISSVDGYIEVSFEIDRNEINPLQIRTMLYQSELRQLFPYLSEIVLTEYRSIDSISLGLDSNVFSYVAAAVSISLIILLLCTHTQLKILFGVKRMERNNIESENESEFYDEVAPMLTDKRTRITRPGSSMPRKSSVDANTERAVSVKSESASYYGKSSVSEIPLFKPRARIMSRPLSPEQIGDLLRESPPYTIQLEFDALPSNLVSVDEMPPGTESKNRYPNVLPPPHSRVPLFLKYNMPTSDYINASFIRGYNMMSRAYIATQGPMYNTMDEFWRMIWEQRCEVILMLTELVERGVHKCTHYWPDKDVSENVIFGELEVTACDKDYKSCYILSRFKIKLRTDIENKEVREVNHFWFKQWPDYGIPETGIPIITLLLDSRTYARDSQSPVLMHCSSGIGRTGVFVAVDVGMHELEKKGRADLLKIVSLIRQDRGGMVQTKDQYLLIYKTLLSYSDFLKKAQQPD